MADPAIDAPLWYFAYGSNLDRSIFIERRRMQPLATRWGWLGGYRLCFNIPIGPGERGVANIEPDPTARTCGGLYLLRPEDFDRLDRTEGVHLNVYRRLPLDVHTPEGECVAASAYYSSLTTTGRKPSPRYMRLILDGARQHGLPGEWLNMLESFDLAIDERATRSGGPEP